MRFAVLSYIVYIIISMWCFCFVLNTFLMKPNKDLNFIECIRCAMCVLLWYGGHASLASCAWPFSLYKINIYVMTLWRHDDRIAVFANV